MTQHKRNGKAALRARQERALAACVKRVERYERALNEAAEEDATADESEFGYLPDDLVRAITKNREAITDLSNKGVHP